jgi:hypothetical protein
VESQEIHAGISREFEDDIRLSLLLVALNPHSLLYKNSVSSASVTKGVKVFKQHQIHSEIAGGHRNVAAVSA